MLCPCFDWKTQIYIELIFGIYSQMMEVGTIEGIRETSSKTKFDATFPDNYNSQVPLEIMASACLPTKSIPIVSPVEIFGPQKRVKLKKDKPPISTNILQSKWTDLKDRFTEL